MSLPVTPGTPFGGAGRRSPTARTRCCSFDLLTGERIEPGRSFGLDAYGVRVLRENH